MSAKKDKSRRKTMTALEIITRYGGSIRPKVFAQEMWPNSPGWDYQRKCGQKGVHAGMGMYCTAGCYLGNLARKGILEKIEKDYTITDEGTKFFAEATTYFKEKDAKKAFVKDVTVALAETRGQTEDLIIADEVPSKSLVNHGDPVDVSLSFD